MPTREELMQKLRAADAAGDEYAASRFAEMIREALQFAGISYWKVTKLKELHLDADEYCEVGESKKNLVIRRNK